MTISRKRWKIETQLQWTTNKKSMRSIEWHTPLPVTLNDPEGHFLLFENFLYPIPQNIACNFYDMCTDESENARGL